MCVCKEREKERKKIYAKEVAHMVMETRETHSHRASGRRPRAELQLEPMGAGSENPSCGVGLRSGPGPAFRASAEAAHCLGPARLL